MRAHLWKVAIAATLIGSGTAATAQDDHDVDKADSRLSRIDQLAADLPERGGLRGEGQLPPPFKFILGVPLTYNSNIDLSDTDRRHDVHADPVIRLDYQQQTGTIRLFARAMADADEYFEHEENGASAIVGRLGVRVVSPSLGKIVPYVHYVPTLVFGRHFSDHQVTTHTVALGAGGKYVFGKVTVQPDFQVARRMSANSAVERNQFGGSVQLLGDLIPDRLSWSLAQTVQARHYTGGANDGRDDINFKTAAGISIPLRPLLSLELNASFEHNSSDRDGKDYSVFDIGPSLVLAVPFGHTRMPSAEGAVQ